MPAAATPSVLGATTANIIKDTPSKPPTKTQKAKDKKQEKTEKANRAKMLAEQQKQKQKQERAVAPSKSSEPVVSLDKTPFIIATDKSEYTSNTSNTTTPSSTAGSPQTTTAFALVPNNGDLPTRAKKIIAEQRKNKLVDMGVGVVVTEKTPNIRKHNPVKKGRQPFTEDDKVVHESANPMLDLICKHQDDNENLRDAWVRVQKNQGIRHVPRRGTVPVKRTTQRNENTIDSFTALLNTISGFDQGQDDDQDNTSDRAITIASSDAGDEVPELVIISTSPLVDDEILAGLPGANDTADNLDERDFSDASSEFEEFLDDKADDDKISALQVQAIAPMPVYDHEAVMEASNNGFAVGDYGDSPPPRDSPYGFAKTIAVHFQPEDIASEKTEEATPFEQADTCDEVLEPEGIPDSDDTTYERNVIDEAPLEPASDRGSTQLDDTSAPEMTAQISAVIEVWDVGFTLEDSMADASEAGSVQDPVEVSSEESVVEVTEPAPWVWSSLLSLPNAAQYPSILTRDQELTLIEMHVTPLCFPDSTHKPSQADKKAATAPLEVADDVTAAAAVESPTPAEPVGSETPVDIEDEQVPTEVSVSPVDKLATPATLQTDTDNFVAGILSLPNGDGQTAAVHELHERLVTMHVASLQLPDPTKRVSKNVSPPAVDTLTSTREEDETSLSLIKLPTAAATPIDEISELVPDIEPKPEMKTAEENPAIPSSDENNKSRGRRRQRSHSSKMIPKSSRTSNKTSLNDLERKTHKARNTYLGGVSLEDFVNKLEFDLSDGTTTKTAVWEAFAALSADETEAIHGERPMQNDVDFNSSYAQRRIKLGTTTLFAFLRGMTFDDEGVTTVAVAMCSFKAAAHQALQPSPKLTAAFHLESGSSRRSSRSHRMSESESDLERLVAV